MKILEMYFGLKMLLPAIFILSLILFVPMVFIKTSLYGKKVDKIDKMMKDAGYKIYLRNVSSCGGRDQWAYRKAAVSVDCDKVYGMKIKDIKKQYK